MNRTSKDKTSNHLISVITPSLNSGEFIERAIKSVLKQKNANYEHIIVDGGSTDSTLSILKKYPHLKWISEADRGQTDAMNKGFSMSQGQIIVNLNADDYFEDDVFSKVIQCFEKDETAQIVMGNVYVEQTQFDGSFLNIPKTEFKDMLRYWNRDSYCYNPLGYFYKREVQISCPFNKNNNSSMDLEFLLNVASKYAITKIDATFGTFVITPNSKTSKAYTTLDFWQSNNFLYVDQYLTKMSSEERFAYEVEKSAGYADRQAEINSISPDSIGSLPAVTTPLVTVIIPTYNCGAFLSRALKSVANQSLHQIEVIIIDDCSADDTQQVIKKFSNSFSKLKIITNDVNKGNGFSRNIGIDAASGKYIFFLDADDYIETECLARLVSIAEKYECEIVACGVDKFDESMHFEKYHFHSLACAGGVESLFHLAEHRVGTMPWNKLFLKEFLNKHSLRFVEGYFHEDILFTFESVFLCKKYLSISNIYCHYFRRPGSITTVDPTPKHFDSYLNVHAFVFDFIDKHRLSESGWGLLLSRKLIDAHCTQFLVPKMTQFVLSRSKSELKPIVSELFEKHFRVTGQAAHKTLFYFLDVIDRERLPTEHEVTGPSLLTSKLIRSLLSQYILSQFYQVKYKLLVWRYHLFKKLNIPLK